MSEQIRLDKWSETYSLFNYWWMINDYLSHLSWLVGWGGGGFAFASINKSVCRLKYFKKL